MKDQTKVKLKAKARRLTTFPRLREVQAARSRVATARTRWARTRLGHSALILEMQAHAHPLTCVGVAAGAGLALGWFVARPWHISSMMSLAYRQARPWIARLLAMTGNPDEE